MAKLAAAIKKWHRRANAADEFEPGMPLPVRLDSLETDDQALEILEVFSGTDLFASRLKSAAVSTVAKGLAKRGFARTLDRVLDIREDKPSEDEFIALLAAAGSARAPTGVLQVLREHILNPDLLTQNAPVEALLETLGKMKKETPRKELVAEIQLWFARHSDPAAVVTVEERLFQLPGVSRLPGIAEARKRKREESPLPDPTPPLYAAKRYTYKGELYMSRKDISAILGLKRQLERKDSHPELDKHIISVPRDTPPGKIRKLSKLGIGFNLYNLRKFKEYALGRLAAAEDLAKL